MKENWKRENFQQIYYYLQKVKATFSKYDAWMEKLKQAECLHLKDDNPDCKACNGYDQQCHGYVNEIWFIGL